MDTFQEVLELCSSHRGAMFQRMLHGPPPAPTPPPMPPLPASPPKLITARDAAKALAICEKTLWALTERGEIPVVRIGRSVRYDPHDLSRWIEQKKATAN